MTSAPTERVARRRTREGRRDVRGLLRTGQKRGLASPFWARKTRALMLGGHSQAYKHLTVTGIETAALVSLTLRWWEEDSR